MEEWKKELRRILTDTPEVSNDDLLEYFGSNNFGYFPTVSDLNSERSLVAQGSHWLDGIFPYIL